jgi:hypothetical protein
MKTTSWIVESRVSGRSGRSGAGLCAALAALVLAAGGAAPAGAIGLVGDDTRLTFSATASEILAGAGFEVNAFGSAFLDDYPNAAPPANPPRIAFPITGGDLFAPDDPFFPFQGTVEHAGSGVDFTLGATTLFLGDFLIDFTTGLLSATALDGAPGFLPLFWLEDCTILAFTTGVACEDSDGSARLDGFGLFLTDQAAAALGAVFFGDEGALAGLTGLQFGIASVDVRFVPEPGTLLLLGAGLAGLAGWGRRAA